MIAGDQKNIKNFVKRNLVASNPRTILDVGCGTGDYLETIPPSVKYLGIDNNEKYLSFAKKHFSFCHPEQTTRHSGLGPESQETEILNQVQDDNDCDQNDKIKFILQDACEAKFYRGKKFDAVLLVSVLHHLSDAQINKLLPLLKKVTKTVIVTDIIPNPPNLLARLLVKLDQGQYIRTEGDKIRILKKHFKIVKKELLPEKWAIQLGVVCET